jgi:hypothetical protein
MSLAVKRKLGPDLEVAARRLVLAARVPASTTGPTTRADHTHRPTECLPLPVNVVASAVAVEVTVVDWRSLPADSSSPLASLPRRLDSEALLAIQSSSVSPANDISALHASRPRVLTIHTALQNVCPCR